MNYCTCAECKVEHHRSEYRKRGGGIYNICKRCRNKLACERNRHRRQVESIRHLTEEDLQSRYKVDTAKALMKEYRTATRQNRSRIKALEKSKKPTRATVTWLNKRRVVQQLWVDALNTLITQLHQNKKVPTLREFMETLDQNADNNIRL